MTTPAPRRLPYGREWLDLPDEPFHLDPILPPSRPKGVAPEELGAAFEHPLASPRLDELFRGARKVLVVVSDATRATGSARFLPLLLDRIRGASKGADVTFIVATGIHRRPTRAEIEEILGGELAARHETLVHDPDLESGLSEVGRTRSGTPVRVNSALFDHDRIVLTGATGFHYYAGFCGGRKALVPGLAARETVSRNHLRALESDGTRHRGARAGRLNGNPVHRDMAEGASLVGPHLLVNSVLGNGGTIERLFVGQWRRAHEAACRYVRATRVVRVEPRDLVVTSAGGAPADINGIQSHKALDAGVLALRPGGVIVLVAACPEGAGHEDFMPWFRFGSEDEWVRALRADFRVYGQTALSWFRKAKAYRIILVSKLDPGIVARLGAEHAPTLEEALRRAREHLPRGTPGWWMPHGSRLLPEPATPQ
jgi:nickel-dependent lactate racemase